MKILITGASGFIGSHIAEEALRLGHDVWCAVRKTTSRKYLQDPRLNFLEINLSDARQMESAFRQLGFGFDAVIHAAGATKCPSRDDFFRTNADGTRNILDALKAAGMRPRFVFVSSFSVVNSIPAEKLGEPTAYGESKLKAEGYVRDSQLPYVILRPTGVYGPREKDYFIMVKSITQHSDFAIAGMEQILTFVYVDDVVQAVMLSITQPEHRVCGGIYPLADGREYSSVTFSDLIIDNLAELNGKRPWVLRIKAPLWLMRIVCTCGEAYNRLFARNNPKRLVTLNKDKYNILTQRDWRCDITISRQQLGFDPQVQLEEGVRRTVRWYKENNWI